MEHLRCVVERITYQNAENGWSVIRCRAKGYQDLVTVVGAMPEVHVGSTYDSQNTGGLLRVAEPAAFADGKRASARSVDGASGQKPSADTGSRITHEEWLKRDLFDRLAQSGRKRDLRFIPENLSSVAYTAGSAGGMI